MTPIIPILLLPFLGTTLGAGTVFFLKNQLNKNFEKLLLGFASGVMVAASVWSLIMPAIESSEAMGLLRGVSRPYELNRRIRRREP